MTRTGLKRAFAASYHDVLQHHTLQTAAALSYYLVLAVFPGLIFLSAIMGLIPLPDLFGRVLGTMSLLLPADTMRVVQSVLLDVLATNRKAWLSFGMVGAIWVASAAFDALTEALDIAYDVHDDLPFWKTRLRAMGLGVITAGLLSSALAVMIVGPRFGIRFALAGDSLGDCHCVYAGSRGSTLFPRPQCEASFWGYVAGSNSRRYMLDRAFVLARVLFLSPRQPQLDLWNAGGIHSPRDLVLLEWVRIAGRSRTQRGNSEGKHQGSTAREKACPRRGHSSSGGLIAV